MLISVVKFSILNSRFPVFSGTPTSWSHGSRNSEYYSSPCGTIAHYRIDVYVSWFFILKSLLYRRCAKPEAHFSSCWCRLLTTNRLTCTGMGTTIFPAPPPFGHCFDRPRTEFAAPPLFFWPCSLLHAVTVDSRLALTRFHFARRFWNHIFTCGQRGQCVFLTK